jgi:hypothetical protein
MPQEVRYTGRRGEEAHFIYSRAEADQRGVPYFKKWRDFSDVGQWILTDDAMVVEVLATGKMRTGTRWLRTCTGTFLCSPGTALGTEPRDSRYTFNGLKAKDQPFRVTARIESWARLFARGKDPIETYLQIFRGISEANAEQRVHMLLQKEEVRDIVREEIDQIMKDLHIDDKYVIKGYKDLFEEGDSDNVKLSALNKIAAIRGVLQPKQNHGPVTNVFAGFGEQKLAQLEAGDKGEVIPHPAPEDADAEVESFEDQFQKE